jgi:hypothetical protein
MGLAVPWGRQVGQGIQFFEQPQASQRLMPSTPHPPTPPHLGRQVLGEQGVRAAQDKIVDEPAQLRGALLAQLGSLVASVCRQQGGSYVYKHIKQLVEVQSVPAL